jgi:NADPH2:quinone reductase
MQAIQVSQVGGPEVLTPSTCRSDAETNEALVQIKAAGVNFIDVYFREGRYPTPLPFIDGRKRRVVSRKSGAK